MSNHIVQVYITALTIEADQVVLWGQTDPQSASVIEKNLPRHIKEIPHVVPNDINDIVQGLKCFAYHTDGKYYRVRVKSVLTGFVQVQTLDYGFTFYVEPHNLRISRYEEDPIIAMPDEAVPFNAYEIATSHELTRGEIDILEKGIVFCTITVKIVATVLERNIALFFKGNYNIQETWLQSGLLQHIPFQIQKAKILNFIQPVLTSPQFSQSRTLPSFPDTSLPPPKIVPAARPKSNLLDNNELLDALAERVKGRIGPKDAPYYPPPVPLAQGTTYSVLVTEATDGPWSFSIQLKKDENLIAKVADDMQKADKVVLRPPIFPGKPCLGFYSTRNLYARGVIVKVSHQVVSVTFVDYGGTEDLSLREVLEMPTYGFQVQTLSQQFSLAQLDQLKGSPDDMAELKQCFTEIVANKPLLLKVTATEENCMQNCELFDGTTNGNVKKSMNHKIKQLKKTFVSETLPQVGAAFRAYISHVESSNEFYVQNRERELEITELLEELQVAATKASTIVEEQIHLGLSCLSLFSDGLWYRARVTSFQKGTASVFFVDYGNSDTVKAASLKEISLKFVKPETMAIRCCLDNPNNLDQTSKLEELINDENVSVSVIEVDSSHIVVKVLHNGINFLDPPSIIPVKENSNLRFAIASPEPSNNWEPTKSPTNEKTNWRDSAKTDNGLSNNDGGSGGFKKRFDNENGGGYKKRFDNDDGGGFRKRFDNEDGGGFKKRFDNGEEGGGYKKRFDNNDGSGFRKRFDNEDGGGYKKRFDNNDGGGFKKRFDNEEDGGGYKKRFDNNDGGGFKKRFDNEEEGGGYKKRFDNNDGGGFKKRFDNEEDGGGYKKRFDNKDGGGFKKRFDNNEDGGDKSNRHSGDNSGSNRPFRMPIRNEERAPADSKYDEQFINPESVNDVTVTFFVSPQDFYVQNYTDKNAFTDMMEKIQTDYLNKFGMRQETVLQEGEIVVAKFSEDRVLYRAEVITPEPITVRFIDYGNVDSVRDNRDVYPVMKNLVDLPRQCVRCSLQGVQPVGDGWTGNFSPFFEKSSLSCTFISEDSGVYSVNLTSEDGEVAGALIAAGLAAPIGSSKLDSTRAENDLTTSSIGLAPYDISLLPGQILNVEIAYINGVDQFFCHYNPSDVQLIEKAISEHFRDPTVKQVLDPEEILPNQLCIANLSSILYRAKIVEKSDEGIWVQFIDYGDTNVVSPSDILKIPEHLSSFSPLSFECRLFGDTSQVSDEDQDKFKEEFELKSVIISIHNLVNESVSVTLYDINGTKAKILESINDSPETVAIPDMPLTANQVMVEVIKLIGNAFALVKLPETSPPDLSSYSFSSDESEKVTVGSACAVRGENELWCRGVRESETEAYLIDIGESQTVSNFCPLPSQLHAIPACVRKVAITCPVLGKHCVEVKKKDNHYTINPTEKLVYITHVESANELYVRSSSLETKQNEIQEILSETIPCELPNSEVFSARYPDDELWYRAKLETREPLCVQFIDFGNKTEVSEVGEVPSSIINIPPLAIHVKFDEDFPDNAMEILVNASFSENPTKIVEKDGKVIDLVSNGTSLVAKMLGRLTINVGDTIYISFIISPEQFYVQRSIDTKLLEDIADKLAGAENFPQVDKDVKILVAAKYSEDDAWYRARIENDQVFFVDHGNYAEISEIRELPIELEKIGPLAQQVSLVNTAGEWSDSAIEAFMEFLDGRPLTVKQAIPCGNSYKLELLEEGVNIMSTLYSQIESQAEDANPSEILPEPHLPDDFSDQTTDDHKFVALTDDQRAESNETDEQKRGKMEGPRSDDEKGEPCASVANMPDELDVTAIIHEIIDNSIARAHLNSQPSVEEPDEEVVSAEDPEDPESSFYSPHPIENINMTDDIATNNSDSNITDDVATNNSDQNITDDLAFNNSDNDSGMSSHPIADISHSPEAGDVDFEDAVCSPGSADTVPTAEDELVEFVPFEETAVVASSQECELEDAAVVASSQGCKLEDAAVVASSQGCELEDAAVVASSQGFELEDAAVVASSQGSEVDAAVVASSQGSELNDAAVVTSSQECEISHQSPSEDPDISKDKARTGGSSGTSRRASICDKIVPGSINRGIDLSNDTSS